MKEDEYWRLVVSLDFSTERSEEAHNDKLQKSGRRCLAVVHAGTIYLEGERVYKRVADMTHALAVVWTLASPVRPGPTPWVVDSVSAMSLHPVNGFLSLSSSRSSSWMASMTLRVCLTTLHGVRHLRYSNLSEHE